jgi:hypothetical protein
MERESFDEPETAALINAELVAIKVDREERPDVDQIYMETVVRLTGHGGWPLNVFCTPDGRPFFGGTYYPPQRMYDRPSFRELVAAIARLYKTDAARVEAQAAQLRAALEQELAPAAHEVSGIDALAELCTALMADADRVNGGFGSAPKFPTPTQLEALLLGGPLRARPADASGHLELTLLRMLRGGLYDQLGGGFHRYSTDAQWLVPHFEKMLYDQGQLLRVYAEAYRQTDTAELLVAQEGTIAYMEREMRAPDGGLYASQDADSEGEEGRFYVWDRAEIEAVLGAERGAAFCEAYGVTASGTFEGTGKSVLALGLPDDRDRFSEARAVLLDARSRRVPPDTDRKHVTAWIGYGIAGLATAAATLERPAWLALAKSAADFVDARLSTGSDREVAGLHRIFDAGRAHTRACLDDYAAMLAAELDLYRAGAGDLHAGRAVRLADAILRRFYDARAQALYLVEAGDPTLIVRPKTDSDGATPGALGLAALGLVRVAALTGRGDLADVIRSMLRTYAPVLMRRPHAMPTLVRAAALAEHGLGIAVVLGSPAEPGTQALAARARRVLGCEDLVAVADPDAWPAHLDPTLREGRTQLGGRPTVYVCRGRTCSPPATEPAELRSGV